MNEESKSIFGEFMKMLGIEILGLIGKKTAELAEELKAQPVQSLKVINQKHI